VYAGGAVRGARGVEARWTASATAGETRAADGRDGRPTVDADERVRRPTTRRRQRSLREELSPHRRPQDADRPIDSHPHGAL
ncbi:MAG TPA: hypothetical protein DCQ04_08395, partial [Actinobacteria bacterium]|nr:hypothetical protein [Actinomycetota bacterium]